MKCPTCGHDEQAGSRPNAGRFDASESILFFRDRIGKDERGWVSFADLYAAYVKWAEEVERPRVLGNLQFSKTLRHLNVERVGRGSQGRGVAGIVFK